MINTKFMLGNIDYLHELISNKHYPNILKLLPFFKRIAVASLSIFNSDDDQRRSVSKIFKTNYYIARMSFAD